MSSKRVYKRANIGADITFSSSLKFEQYERGKQERV